jgi:D-alanyl-D-alanine carboxypeptidase
MAVLDRHHGQWRRHGLVGLVVVLVVAIVLMAGQVNAAGKSAVLVLDANTGRVLHESAADEPRHPASLAKMMTLYLAFELIEQGRLSYQTKLKISANAAETAPTKLGLEEGEEIALIDAIKALITKSANDMAVAIAEHIAGSEEKFAKLMTQKAHQLGMSATTFQNASGLPDDDQVTTARDMVTLALHLQDDFPKHYPLFATRSFTYKDETFSNHNTMLSNYEGTDGIKTGYTRASGFNLVASVRRGRKHVVGAIFGGASAASRNAAMRTFLNMGLVKASNEKTRKSAPLLVAQAKPTPDRRIGPVPTPRRVERPMPQAAQVSAVPAPVEAAAPRAPAIEIARVRSVLVPGRAANPAADEPLQPARTSGPGFEDVLARAEWAPAKVEPAPGGRSPVWTTAASGNPPMRLSAAPTERPTLLSDAGSARGTPPSTLEQQAANLSRGEPPVVAPQVAAPVHVSSPSKAHGEAKATAGVAAGTFHIQIGAYQSQAEAEKRLASARELAPGVLTNRAPVMTQVKQGDKLFFRARYAGFEAKAAANACTELKRLKIDCLVMKAE